MFWVTWLEAVKWKVKWKWAHSFVRCVAQFFPQASSQVSIFDFCCLYNMIQIKVFYNISFLKDRCEAITTNEHDVVTCNDLIQILWHKLECLILKRMDSWLNINWQLGRSALQNTLMLDLPLQQQSNWLCYRIGYRPCYSQGLKNLPFLLTDKCAITRYFLACLRNLTECDHMHLPIWRQLQYRPCELNSNAILDRSNCFKHLRKKQSTGFDSIRKLCTSTITPYISTTHLFASGVNWIFEIQVLQTSLTSFTLIGIMWMF